MTRRTFESPAPNNHKRQRVRGPCAAKLQPEVHQLPTPPTGRSCSPTEDAIKPVLPSTAVTPNHTFDLVDSREQSCETDKSDTTNTPRCRRPTRKKVLDAIRLPGCAYPSSLFQDGAGDERIAVQELFPLALARGQDGDDIGFAYLTLKEFTIYRPPEGPHASEMVSLGLLNQSRTSELRFDGILTLDNEHRYYVQNVPFATHTVEGYGDEDAVDLGDLMCIQSPWAARHNLWYKLGRPAAEYRRFYNPFVWLARFTKHFIDYLLQRCSDFSEPAKRHVSLENFRQEFYRWLLRKYNDDKSFQTWLQAGPGSDFRQVVTAQYNYLWREAYNVGVTMLRTQAIWNEVLPNCLRAIKAQPNKIGDTIVTPYVFSCFKHLYFKDLLRVQAVGNPLVTTVAKRKLRLRLTPLVTASADIHDFAQPKECQGTIEVGDVVRVRPDEESVWTSTDPWYAYVQAINPDLDKSLRFDVLWLYAPCDTTIGKSIYPYPNELFMSDNCSCGRQALLENDILGMIPVVWHPEDAMPQDQYFIRQRFRTVADDDFHDFTTLDPTIPPRCFCKQHISLYEDCRMRFHLNQTVLVRERAPHACEDRLQPAQILAFIDDKRLLKVRMFHRKNELEFSAAPNEVVLTDLIKNVGPTRIVRHCSIRSFASTVLETEIPTPYDRDGTGDYFFVRKLDGQSLSTKLFPQFEEGPDPSLSKSKLSGLALFCGGGNFDRGLEEGGAVTFKHAVDWDHAALHSYRANVATHEQMEFFLGSVNDYLYRAMRGSDCMADSTLATPGRIDVISAGSPCPGFSALQQDKLSFNSIRNASLVASVISFVDFYSPRYFVLENVVTMTHGMGKNKDENIFAQIIAALVGLGYQVQQFLMDSWSYGSPQQRSRVFIIASAPGSAPFVPPAHSHSHPTMSARSLGRSSNGLPFGRRRNEYTAFSHNTPESSCRDLPFVGDSQPQFIPSHPDHRTPCEETILNRQRMAVVPTFPRGMGIIDLHRQRGLTGEPAEWIQVCSALRRQKSSKSYSRVFADRLFPTVTTSMTVQDGFNGRTMHWDEPRLLTLMEVRRAQGFLDHEVLVGMPSEKMRIIGNSVDRRVALVLGLALKASVDATAERRARTR